MGNSSPKVPKLGNLDDKKDKCYIALYKSSATSCDFAYLNKCFHSAYISVL